MTCRVTSGMRPTGSLHLGNLLGAVNNWVQLQEQYECYFFIVDWHALTTPGSDTAAGSAHVDLIPRYVMDMATDWISAGLDAEKCAIFVQSSVPEVAELHLLFSMLISVTKAESVPTYREVVDALRIENPSYGLLGYPILQAADILAYKGNFVPVGKDQIPHINLTKDIAARFNALYGDVFPSPEALLTEIPRVPGIDGLETKMGKSADNHIALGHSEEETTRRVLAMYTDPTKQRKADLGHPDGCVAYHFHTIYSTQQCEHIRVDCESGKIGCVDCKRKLSERLNASLRPFRETRQRLTADPRKVLEILANGTSRARQAAAETMLQVREAMSLGPRSLEMLPKESGGPR